jgi:hypothetical protein
MRAPPQRGGVVWQRPLGKAQTLPQRSRSGRRSSPAWWTAADQADLDLLIFEFVKVAALHHERCSTCKAGAGWCPALSGACEELVEWRDGRMLASRATYLRSGQELLEFGARLGFTADQVRELQARWRAEEAL